MTPTRTSMWLVLISLSAALAHAEDAVLPAAAQESFDRGLAAAKQQEWGLATRYFTEAQKAAPEAPPILYNLGLTHAKAGHELATIAWLHAYLAADPRATNADAIRAEVERLQSSARGKMTNIFQEIAKVIAGMEDASQRRSALDTLAQYEAMAGEMEMAAQLKAQQSSAQEDDSWAWRWYAGSLAQAGDLEGARAVLPHIHAPAAQDGVWQDLASALAQRRAADEARAAAERIQDPAKRAEALKQVRIVVLTDLIEAQAIRGEMDPVPLEELLPLLDEWRRGQLVAWVTTQYALHGQTDMAQRAVSQELQHARQISDVGSRIMAIGPIARTQLTVGEGKAAKATAKELLALSPPSYLNPYRGELAAAQALLGNFKAAHALIDSIEYSGMAPTQKDFAYGHLAFVQAMTGDLRGAQKTAQRAARECVSFARQRNSGQAPTHQHAGWCEARIAEALIAKGQLDEALATLQQSEIKWMPFHVGMTTLVDAYLARGDLTGAVQIAKRLLIDGDDVTGMDIAGVAQRRLLTFLEARVTTAPDEVRPIAAELARALTAAARTGRSVANDTMTFLQRVAALQERAGDAAAARATMDSIALTVWLQFAQFLSQDDAVVNLEQKLREASTVNWAGQAVQSRTALSQMTWVAAQLGSYLLQLNALEHRLAQTAASSATTP